MAFAYDSSGEFFASEAMEFVSVLEDIGKKFFWEGLTIKKLFAMFPDAETVECW